MRSLCERAAQWLDASARIAHRTLAVVEPEIDTGRGSHGPQSTRSGLLAARRTTADSDRRQRTRTGRQLRVRSARRSGPHRQCSSFTVARPCRVSTGFRHVRRRVSSDRIARRVPGQDHASDASAECETAGVDHAAGAVRSPAGSGFSPRGMGPQYPGRNLVGLRRPVLDRQAAQHSGSDADTQAPRAGQATGRPPTQPAGGAAIRVDRDAPRRAGGPGNTGSSSVLRSHR